MMWSGGKRPENLFPLIAYALSQVCFFQVVVLQIPRTSTRSQTSSHVNASFLTLTFRSKLEIFVNIIKLAAEGWIYCLSRYTSLYFLRQGRIFVFLIIVLPLQKVVMIGECTHVVWHGKQIVICKILTETGTKKPSNWEKTSFALCSVEWHRLISLFV